MLLDTRNYRPARLRLETLAEVAVRNTKPNSTDTDCMVKARISRYHSPYVKPIIGFQSELM